MKQHITIDEFDTIVEAEIVRHDMGGGDCYYSLVLDICQRTDTTFSTQLTFNTVGVNDLRNLSEMFTKLASAMECDK
jgi:imidazoleglycerol phosphate dehydratase HisB